MWLLVKIWQKKKNVVPFWERSYRPDCVFTYRLYTQTISESVLDLQARSKERVAVAGDSVDSKVVTRSPLTLLNITVGVLSHGTKWKQWTLRWCYTGQLATPTCNADSQRMFFAQICRHATLLNRFQNLATRCSTANIAKNRPQRGVTLESFSRNIVSLQVGVANWPV